MSQPPPESGDVIRHWYLWHYEANQGAEEGAKSRPCLVVRTDLNEHDETKVYVAPITTQPPLLTNTKAHSIPATTQHRLGLGVKPSWIITNELNSFTWVGPDVDRTARHNKTSWKLPELASSN